MNNYKFTENIKGIFKKKKKKKKKEETWKKKNECIKSYFDFLFTIK